MSKSIKTINDLDTLFEKGLIEKDGVYECPVCKKQYKRKASAEAHLAKKDCYSLKDLFSGTMHETRAYAIYQELIGMMNPNARLTLNTFRGSPYYNGATRLTLFIALHTLTDQRTTYLTWLNEFRGANSIHRIFSEGTKETNLRSFRSFLRHFPQFIESASYFERYKDILKNDEDFFIRSLETSKMSLDYILNRSDFPFERIMESMNNDNVMRFEALANEVLTGEIPQ